MVERKYTKQALNFAKNLRRNQTHAENVLWFNIRNNKLQGIKFRCQFPIDIYIADFVCLEKKLIIELDGSQHIDNTEYDNKRTNYFNSLGYTVIRFFDNDVLMNINTVLECIYKKYNEL